MAGRLAMQRLALLLPLLLLWTVAIAAQPPGARVLVPVEAAEALAGTGWRAQVCGLLPAPCDAQALVLFRPRDARDPRQVVVLSERPLALAELRLPAGGEGWARIALHDYTGYAHGALEGREGQLSLAPALYPLGEGRWAVAVVAAWSEMYAGGGASFRVADFVPLKEGGRTAAPVHAGIPFACHKQVRACFSAQEVRRSAHCHDESSGSLRIAYGPPPAPGAYSAWTFSWHEESWPAHAPRSATATARSVLRFSAAEAGRVSFCGGPQ